jgi:hypothetical protein
VGYEAIWLIEKRVALIRFFGVVTIEDAAAATHDSIRLISEGDAPVHIVNDTTAIEKYPSLLELRRVGARETHPKTGLTVIAVTHPVVRFLISILLQFAGTKFRIVSTRQEAVDYLMSYDMTLSDQNAHST